MTLRGSIAGSRLITGLLYDLTPNDPVSIVFAIIALTTVALIAGSIPAHRASRVDPVAALKTE